MTQITKATTNGLASGFGLGRNAPPNAPLRTPQPVRNEIRTHSHMASASTIKAKTDHLFFCDGKLTCLAYGFHFCFTGKCLWRPAKIHGIHVKTDPSQESLLICVRDCRSDDVHVCLTVFGTSWLKRQHDMAAQAPGPKDGKLRANHPTVRPGSWGDAAATDPSFMHGQQIPQLHCQSLFS